MRLIKLLVMCLLVVSGSAMAIDPTDEDVSYMPNMIEPGYGYNEAAYNNCILKKSKKSQTQEVPPEILEACRIKATPKKCRTVSYMLPDNANAKSPQQICAEACKSAGAGSSKRGDCSLN